MFLLPSFSFIIGHTALLVFHILQQPSSSKSGTSDHLPKKRPQEAVWSEYAVRWLYIVLQWKSLPGFVAISSEVVSTLLYNPSLITFLNHFPNRVWFLRNSMYLLIMLACTSIYRFLSRIFLEMP